MKIMKTTKILSIFFAGLLLFASCDKIEADANGNYIVFSGNTGTWYDSDIELPATQRAIVEKYTGVRCTNCPDADVVINTALGKYGETLLAIGVHSGRFGEPLNGEQDLRTEEGTAWFEFFGITAQPSAIVNRTHSGSSWDLFTPTAGFDDRIDAIVNRSAQVAVQVLSRHNASNNYTADIYLDYKDDLTVPQTLTLLVIEDSIFTTQRGQGEEFDNYAQNHVLRQVVTNEWGMDIDASGTKGTRRFVSLSFDLREDCLPEHCHLVAFVSNKETRLIINAAECELK